MQRAFGAVLVGVAFSLVLTAGWYAPAFYKAYKRVEFQFYRSIDYYPVQRRGE
jgi:hypothetical protein